MECLLVRERPGDDWRLFYDWISGFEYEPGYRYTLTVGRKTVRNPPADGSSLEYRLKSVQGKVASPRFELLERAREAEELWRREAPVDYVMVQERGCFCLPDARGPVRLVVTRPGGAEAVFEQVISRHYVEDERPVPFEFSRNFLSVWELFGYLRHAVAREAHVIDVEFDEAFGYPRRVFVDSEAGMADDELEYLVHSLEAA